MHGKKNIMAVKGIDYHRLGHISTDFIISACFLPEFAVLISAHFLPIRHD